MNCLSCHAETTNGLALCDLCQRKGSTCLEFLPVHFRNLARQRKPGRPNGSLGASGTWLIRRGESDGSKIAPALERAANDIDTWATAFADDRGAEPPRADTDAETFAALCAFLDEHLTSIATLEWAGQFLRDLDRHERALGRLTETTVPGWYAGSCRQVTGRDMEGNIYTCGAATHVVPGLTWVTCGGCGTTTYARDHLPVILDEARDWIARPMRLAEAAVALIDTEPSIPRLFERIKKWEQREKIAGVRKLDADGDPVGPKRYRFGDVLDLIFKEGATRPNATEARAS